MNVDKCKSSYKFSWINNNINNITIMNPIDLLGKHLKQQ